MMNTRRLSLLLLLLLALAAALSPLAAQTPPAPADPAGAAAKREREDAGKAAADKKAAAAAAAEAAKARFLAEHGRLAARDAKGRLVPVPAPAPPELLNPVHSGSWLEALRDRADYVLRTSVEQKLSFNTYFENEKYALGHAMARAVAGDFTGFSKLYEEDANAADWHARTAGIDYFACFVIKHQPRKYFHFGPLLPPDYLARMREGARLWTEQDPNRRPSDVVKKGAKGYGPDAVNSWVDTRTTDNLSMMRFAAVCLFAEESGSAEVAAAYKRRLARFAAALYRAGNGEWDSENYLGHTITPVFNLHDFAKDPAVRAMAKGMLDWWLAALAVKYHNGGAAGPNCRDYNHTQPFGGSLAETGWLFFGAPRNPQKFEYDIIHALTSSYVPPPAVVNLGTRSFDRPRELLNTKPPYHEPQAGDYSKPAAYHETYYYGRAFILGTLAEGTTPGGDVNGFKLTFDDPERGVADIRFAPTDDPVFTGSALYKKDKIRFPNRAAQNRGAAVFLAKGSGVPWRISLPLTVKTEVADGVTFLRGAAAWAAVHPLNLESPFAPDDAATRQLQFAERKVKKDGATVMETYAVNPDHCALAASGREQFSGFALEVGEAPEFESYEAFKAAVLAAPRPYTGAIGSGAVAFKTAGGRGLEVRWGDTLAEFEVLRDGARHDWAEHGRYVYRETGKGPEGLIHQLRGPDGGALTINAGGRTFAGRMSGDGIYTWENR